MKYSSLYVGQFLEDKTLLHRKPPDGRYGLLEFFSPTMRKFRPSLCMEPPKGFASDACQHMLAPSLQIGLSDLAVLLELRDVEWAGELPRRFSCLASSHTVRKSLLRESELAAPGFSQSTSG